MKKLTLLVLLSSSLSYMVVSCKQQLPDEKPIEYRLSGVYSSDSITQLNDLVVIDSAEIKKITINYLWHGKPYKRIRTFKKINDKVYEQKLLNYFDSETIDTLYVLSFLQIDTSYNYIFDRIKYKKANRLIGFDDWKFTILKNGVNYKLTKNHLTDSTFIEEFFYDNSFKINGVNLYSGTDTVMFKSSN